MTLLSFAYLSSSPFFESMLVYQWIPGYEKETRYEYFVHLTDTDTNTDNGIVVHFYSKDMHFIARSCTLRAF